MKSLHELKIFNLKLIFTQSDKNSCQNLISKSSILSVLQQMDGGLGTMLIKVALFALVQALVYLILSKSSRVFSKSNSLTRAYSFRPMRSVSFRRILAALQDIPAGDEMSLPSNGSSSPSTSSQDEAATTTATS